jgi:hypothetical protein
VAALDNFGHVFLSYVHEDSNDADDIQAHLEAAGIPVWRDKNDLWGGTDWKDEIRSAISDNALVFLVCFSETSLTKEKSYQWQEITFAIDELNLRNPSRPWLIPVRLTPCEVPDLRFGGGRTLGDLQRIDLFQGDRAIQISKLLGAVGRILNRDLSSQDYMEPRAPMNLSNHIKGLIVDDSKRIELDDLVILAAGELAEKLSDVNQFPVTLPVGIATAKEIFSELARVSNEYAEATRELSKILIIGCTWGNEKQDDLWRRAIQRTVGTLPLVSGNTGLLDAREIPLQILLYSTGLAALHRSRFGTLKSVLLDAKFRRNGLTTPIVGMINPGFKFQGYEVVAQLLAGGVKLESMSTEDFNEWLNGRVGRRYTPHSDWLELQVREAFRESIHSDDDFRDLFDRFEYLASALIMDGVIHNAIPSAFHSSPIFGCYLWRNRRRAAPVDLQMLEEIANEGENWPPLLAGLFGSKVNRAIEAFARVRGETAAAAAHMS